MNKWVRNIAAGTALFFAGVYFGSNIGTVEHHNDPWGFASTVSVENLSTAQYLSKFDNFNQAFAIDIAIYYEKEFRRISNELDECNEEVREQIQAIIESGNLANLIEFLKDLGKTPIRQAEREKKQSIDGIYLEVKKRQLEC